MVKVRAPSKNGLQAALISIPVFPKKEENEQQDEDEGEENPILVGFKSIPVFGISQTEHGPDFEGEKILIEKRDDFFLKDFPLMGAAEKWGIKVKAEYSIGGEGRLD